MIHVCNKFKTAITHFKYNADEMTSVFIDKNCWHPFTGHILLTEVLASCFNCCKKTRKGVSSNKTLTSVSVWTCVKSGPNSSSGWSGSISLSFSSSLSRSLSNSNKRSWSFLQSKSYTNFITLTCTYLLAFSI